jgi:hypothetical protein
VTYNPSSSDTTTYVAAREALLALTALAGDQAESATDPSAAQLWTGRREDWTRRFRELQPDDTDAQQHILAVDAALLREHNNEP